VEERGGRSAGKVRLKDQEEVKEDCKK